MPLSSLGVVRNPIALALARPAANLGHAEQQRHDEAEDEAAARFSVSGGDEILEAGPRRHGHCLTSGTKISSIPEVEVRLRKSISAIGLALLACLGSSCTKSYTIASISVGPPPTIASDLGEVGIVLGQSSISDQYVTHIGANAFVYRGARESFSRAFLEKLRPICKDARVLKDESTIKGLDYVLYPTLSADTKDRWFAGQAIRLKFTVVAKASDGRVVSEQTSEMDQRYMEDGAKAFQATCDSVFNVVLDAVVQDINAAKKRTIREIPTGKAP